MVKVTEKKLGRQQAHGLYHPDKKMIEIEPRLPAKRELEVYIHEFLHHLHPEWTEEMVDKTAKKICNYLWKQKYRKIK